jgi:hypothetical protein
LRTNVRRTRYSPYKSLLCYGRKIAKRVFRDTLWTRIDARRTAANYPGRPCLVQCRGRSRYGDPGYREVPDIRARNVQSNINWWVRELSVRATEHRLQLLHTTPLFLVFFSFTQPPFDLLHVRFFRLIFFFFLLHPSIQCVRNALDDVLYTSAINRSREFSSFRFSSAVPRKDTTVKDTDMAVFDQKSLFYYFKYVI